MRNIDLHQVDAFTDVLFGGNAAGVVSNAEGLDDETMRHIAREMNLSETAFVMPPTDPTIADVRLRFFTPPGDEIKFCGHATVGALAALAIHNKYSLGQEGASNVAVETQAGILPMVVTNAEGAHPAVTFTAPAVELEPYRLQGADFAQQFGVDPALLAKDAAIMRDTNLNYVYIPTTGLDLLGKQQFDYTRVRSVFGEEGVVVFCFFTNESIDGKADLHARGLAPNVGVDEDPFTGSMQAGLVHAAKASGYIDSGKRQITTQQGHFMGRPGFANIEHNTETNELRVTASAVPVFSTTMEIK